MFEKYCSEFKKNKQKAKNTIEDGENEKKNYKKL